MDRPADLKSRRRADRRTAALSRRFADALLDGDPRRVTALAQECEEAGLSAVQVFDDVIAPAMHRVGDLWEAREITVADEHLATALVHRALIEVYARLVDSATEQRERILLATVEGEHHELGLRMAADVLEGAGFDVVYLGANVPTDALVEAVERHRPRLVGLSISLLQSSTALERTVAALQRSSPYVAIFLGGQGVSTRLRGLCVPVVDSLDELLETVEHALGRRAARAILPPSLPAIATPTATEQGIGTVEDSVRSVAADLADVTRIQLREARELRRRVYLDPVTGQPNRAAFEDHFARALAGHRGELTVLMVDVDDFKAINDRGGHASGDDALRRVGEIMADELRPGDFICRYGGDEFAALLSDTSPAEAAEVAERLRAAIQAGSHLTLSVGVAVCGDDLRAGVLRADQALYAAKAGGRNRVRYASGPDGRASLRPHG